MKIRKIKPTKPFYCRVSDGHGFLTNDIIRMDSTKTKYLVLDNDVKDKKWKKFFRNLGMTKFLLYFGINIYDHSGCIKVKLYKK